MFNADFYPTPDAVINEMLDGYDITDKIFLEPSAGKGNIVDYLLANGAKEVLACETNEDLSTILNSKCNVIGDDFLLIEGHQISHIDAIVMNPPFSADEKHILHAFDIAPEGCKIIALCNYNTVSNRYTTSRKRLSDLIQDYGELIDLGECFSEAERKTNVQIGLIKLQKPGSNYSTEFEGFFMDEDPEEAQSNGIMQYNAIRDLVNRYVEAIKIFDRQIEDAVKLDTVLSNYFNPVIALVLTQDGAPKTRNEFKKGLQKSGWTYIFNKLNMQKYATRGLKEDINKFVEKQTHVPFTMRNIYKMLEIIVGTQGQRMDKALLEVFDKLTTHYHENRYSVEGWKTNSHYLINEKFILPYMCATDKYNNGPKINLSYGGNFDLIEDMLKATCYLLGTNYDDCTDLRTFLRERNCEYGVWYSWGYFEVRAFKKGTMHFKFNSMDLWARFNQRVAKLKGYPLFEGGVTKPKPGGSVNNSKASSNQDVNVLMTFNF